MVPVHSKRFPVSLENTLKFVSAEFQISEKFLFCDSATQVESSWTDLVQLSLRAFGFRLELNFANTSVVSDFFIIPQTVARRGDICCLIFGDHQRSPFERGLAKPFLFGSVKHFLSRTFESLRSSSAQLPRESNTARTSYSPQESRNLRETECGTIYQEFMTYRSKPKAV